MVKDPHKHLHWICFEDKDWLVGGQEFSDVSAIYKKHGELPGGHKLNEITERLKRIQERNWVRNRYDWNSHSVKKVFEGWYPLIYEDHEHYRIRIRRKA